MTYKFFWDKSGLKDHWLMNGNDHLKMIILTILNNEISNKLGKVLKIEKKYRYIV
jgi:hypothetical protein